MFKKMRRVDRELDRSEAAKILETGNYGVLSTVGQDGYAYGIPLNYVYRNGSLYFHGALDGHKYENIAVNNRVSFCVVGEAETLPERFSTKYQSAIAFGEIYVVEGEEKREALLGFIEKYSREYMEKGVKYIDSDQQKTKVLKINVEHISGKARTS